MSATQLGGVPDWIEVEGTTRVRDYRHTFRVDQAANHADVMRKHAASQKGMDAKAHWLDVARAIANEIVDADSRTRARARIDDTERRIL